MDFNKLAIRLQGGSHYSPKDGMCIMECVAYIAGEKHTDKPECADSTLGQLAIMLNDKVQHCGGPSMRQRLLPLVLRLAGSKTKDTVVLRTRGILANIAIRHLRAAEHALHEAHRYPQRRPVKMNPAMMMYDPAMDMKFLNPMSTAQMYESTNIRDAEIELHHCWDEAFHILDSLLPTMEDAYCGFEPEVVETKLHELEEITT